MTTAQVEIEHLQATDHRRIAVLSNGLIAIAQRLAGAGPVVSVQYRVKTGSIYEGAHTGKGLSHFLEHLVAGGATTNRTEDANNARLADIGGQMNAFTGLDGVGYYINTLAEHTAEAVDLLTDWVMNNAVDADEVEREREVILREFEMGAGEPARVQWKLTQDVRFRAHPARHPIIGYLEPFKSVTREELLAFHRAMYVPNNALCVVVGDIEPAEVIEQIATAWTARKAAPLPALVFPQEPPVTGFREAVGYADLPHPRVRLAWQGVRLGSDQEPALDALAAVLGQGESSRLVRRLRDEARTVTSIHAYNAAFEFDDGLFGIDFQPTPPPEAKARRDDAARDLQAIEAAVVTEINKLRQEPPTDAELSRVKRQILAGVVQSDQSVEQVAGRLCRTVTALGDPDHLERYNQAIQSLTPDALLTAAERLLASPPTMRIALLPLDEAHPSPTPMPEQMPVPLAGEQRLPQQTIDLDNRVLVDQMRGHIATSAQDKNKHERAEKATVVEHRLGCGLTVLIEPSRRLPAVSMQLYRPGGLLGDKPGQEGVCHAVSAMRMRGAGGQSAAALAEAVESLGATLDTGSGQSTDYAAATALKEDFQQVLGLMADVLCRPSLAESEWATMQPRILAAIDNQAASWRGELGLLYREAYFGDHPWSQSSLGRRAVVASLDVEALRVASEKRHGFQSAVLAITGDIDPDQAIKHAEQLFGEPVKRSMQCRCLMEPLPQAGVRFAKTAKPTTAVQVGLGPGVARGDADYPALAVLTRLVSNFPSGYLDRALRGEGPGLVYAVGASLRTGAVPGAFEIVFNTDPANLAEAVRRTQAVIDRLREGEIDPAMLKRAKAKLLSGEFLGKQTLGARAADLALTRLYGADAVSGQAFLDRAAALSALDLQETAGRCLQNAVWAVISPDEAAERILPNTLAK